MKITDDPRAKIRLWAMHPRVVAAPRFPGYPGFKSRRFDSYEAFNQWKREQVRGLARNGGVRWTSCSSG